MFDDFETMSRFWFNYPKTKQKENDLITFTCASVIFKPFANCERSDDAKYFCRWKRFSNSCKKEKEKIEKIKIKFYLQEFVDE